jgi:hypothetical protein
MVAGITAGATVTAAIIAAVAAYFASRRERRRVLYSEAFKAALGWQEMLYRVRRRTLDNQSETVAMFHELQERITYYEGWIGSESKFMARSFRRLVRAVKDGTETQITKAWGEPIRAIPGNATPDDDHPRFVTESEAFLKDVRGYLSPWQFRKLWVVGRNKDKGA